LCYQETKQEDAIGISGYDNKTNMLTCKSICTLSFQIPNNLN